MKPNGDYVFEFYDEDYAEELEEKESKLKAIVEEYNEVDFEGNLNDEQILRLQFL